jgi:polyhydroxybutyrate depolymerase
MRWRTDFNDLADEKGFIVAYPAGTGSKGVDRMLYWNSGPKAKDAALIDVDDVAFIRWLIDDVSGYFTVDPKRVYCCGFSNGSHMSYRIGCQLYDRIAAIGPVSGQRAPGDYFPPPAGPLNIIHIHGTADQYSPYKGGDSQWSAFEDLHRAPVPAAIQAWAKRAGCDEKPAETKTVGKARMERFGPGKQGAEVVLWTCEGAGHTWPGGKVLGFEVSGKMLGVKVAEPVGDLNTDINATRLIWDFFEKHPKP